MKLAIVLLSGALLFLSVYSSLEHQDASFYRQMATEWRKMDKEDILVRDQRIALLESELTELQDAATHHILIDRSCFGGPREGESMADYAKRFKAAYGIEFQQ
jgi:hypothetical protein